MLMFTGKTTIVCQTCTIEASWRSMTVAITVDRPGWAGLIQPDSFSLRSAYVLLRTLQALTASPLCGLHTASLPQLGGEKEVAPRFRVNRRFGTEDSETLKQHFRNSTISTILQVRVLNRAASCPKCRPCHKQIEFLKQPSVPASKSALDACRIRDVEL